MYITESAIREIEQRYGAPQCLSRIVQMNEQQLSLVKRGQRNGRRHDVTLFIVRDDSVALVRKPGYSPGAYRAPSGGVELGESFEAGALREAREETGLEIRLERYLIRCEVDFCGAGESIPWVSHVMLASSDTVSIAPIDTHEIEEARWATFQEVAGPIRSALLSSGSPGLKYRAELDGMALQLVQERLNAVGTSGKQI